MKKKQKILKLTASILAASLSFSAVVSAEALGENTAAQITTAIALTESDVNQNGETIKILLQQCIEQLGEDHPVSNTLKSIIVLLDTGNADAASVTALLKSVVDQAYNAGQDTTATETQEPSAETEASDSIEDSIEDSGEETAELTETTVSDSGLPIYEISSFIKTVLHESVLVDVPGNWGNNASGRALTSYSPVNDSGAISPAAGTLTVSYFPIEGQDTTEAFDTYEKNIADMSMTTSLTAEDATAANLPARKIDFTMSVGANQFTCETICFAHEEMIYAIELMQGHQTTYDYFPAYHQVVGSAEVGTEQMIADVLAQVQEPDFVPEPETTPEPDFIPEPEPPVTDTVPETDVTPEPDFVPEPETTPEPEIPTDHSATRDIGTFLYQINGNTYQFPTAVQDIAPEDMQLDRQLTLPYDFSSDADMMGESWTELVNTQYYYFESSLYKEMFGVTNMSGYPVMMSECMLTALVDTQGTYINITLPGDIKVGSPESDIINGFPEFAGMPMDGTAAFRGNELLYACNVRDDGCNGYVLIRNDAPYYSAVSIICENGIIKEISYECLGSVRANGVFL